MTDQIYLHSSGVQCLEPECSSYHQVVKVPTKQRDGDQILPSVNDEVDCQTRLMNRISQEVPLRRQVGIERYGTALQPFNGRDSLRDLWEELLDASTYFMQVEAEYSELVNTLWSVVDSWADASHMSKIREAERLLMRLGVLEPQG